MGRTKVGDAVMTTKTANEKKADKTLQDLFMNELADVYHM